MSKENTRVLLAFIVLAFLAYRDCFDIFIPSDNFSELFYYAQKGTGGIKQHIDDGVIYFFSTPVVYLLYGLFGINSYGWNCTSVFLHATIAFLIFLIAANLVKPLFDKQSKYLGFFSALLFLLSPYQTDEVIWTPTNLGMLLSALWTLMALYFSLNYFLTGKDRFLLFLYLSFLFSVFSYECGFFLPFVCLALYAYLRFANTSEITVKKMVLNVFIPLFSFVLLYFLICRIFFGEWFLHGGDSLDLRTNIVFLSGNLIKYFAKFFVMFRYWNFFPLEEWIKDNHSEWYFIGSFFIILISFLFFVKTGAVKKKNKSFGLVLALFLCFLFSLVPVLPLDASFLRMIYSDRYGYLPSAFFYMFGVVGIYLLFKRSAFVILPCLAILFWMLLNKTISVWKETNQYCYVLLKNFEPYMDQDKIYILNLPSYYNGTAAFRTGFLESIYFKYHKEVPEKNITIISHSYMTDVVDSFSVSRKNPRTFEVSVPKRRDPYFGSSAGWAQSYKNYNFIVDFDSSKCSYLLSFRDSIPKNAVILYVSGTAWKKIEL